MRGHEHESRRSVAAVVVTYQPDATQLMALLCVLRAEVKSLIVVDNDGPTGRVPRFIHPDDIYLPLAENVGLAAAQNLGIQRALELDVEFVYLSDQDSLPAPGLIDRLLEAHRSAAASGSSGDHPPIAAVGPIAVDARTKRLTSLLAEREGRPVFLDPVEGESGLIEVGTLMASGTLLHVDAIRALGGMRSGYFIDHVDTEWCRRARAAGFRLLAVPAARMEHRVGKAMLHLWLFRWRSIQFRSPMRDYYLVRNSLLMLQDVPMAWSWRWVLVWRRLLVHSIVSLILGGQRLTRVRLIVRGLRDGLGGRRGRLDLMTGKLMRIDPTPLDP